MSGQKTCRAAIDDDPCSGRGDAVGVVDQNHDYRIGCPKHVGRLAAAVRARDPSGTLTIFVVSGTTADVKVAEQIAAMPGP